MSQICQLTFLEIKSWTQFNFEPKTEGKSTLFYPPISHCQKIQWHIFKCIGQKVDLIANSSTDSTFSYVLVHKILVRVWNVFKAAVRMLSPNRCSGYISAFKNILLPASCLPQPNVVVGAGAQPVGPNTLSKALCPTLLFFTLSPAKRTKLHGQAFPLLVGFCFPLVTPCSFIWSRSAVAFFFPIP